MATLYLRGLIDVVTLRLLASRQAAALWVAHVAALDAAVRMAAGGKDDDVPIAERFWRDYAEGTVWTSQFVLGPAPVAPGGVQ